MSEVKCSTGYDSHVYCPDEKCEFHRLILARKDTLSNGVAMGVWSNPAGKSLSDHAGKKLSLENVIKESDLYKAQSLTIRQMAEEIRVLREQRNEAYRQHIETKYIGVSAIEIYEQTKYEAELQIEAAKKAVT